MARQRRGIAKLIDIFVLRYSSRKRLIKPINQSTVLQYIRPRWNGSRISADCQQKLFSVEHNNGAIGE